MKLTTASLLALFALAGCAPASPPREAPARASLGGAAIAATATAEQSAASSTSAPRSVVGVAHVIGEGGVRVVLSSRPDDAWGKGPAELVSKGSPLVVRRAVDAKKLPPELVAAEGQRVELMKAGEVVCEAKIAGFSIVGRVEPYFGTRAEWEGTGEEGKRPLKDAEVAREAWDLTSGGRVLAAELEKIRGSACAEATWARDAGARGLPVAGAKEPRSVLYSQALEAFRALPGYGEVQERFEASGPSAKGTPWETSDDMDVTVKELSSHDVQGAWVWVSARSSGGCDAFHGSFSALFELRSGPFGAELTLRHAGGDAPETSPEAAVETRGDGRIELIFPNARLRGGDAGYALEELSIPFLDCPC